MKHGQSAVLPLVRVSKCGKVLKGEEISSSTGEEAPRSASSVAEGAWLTKAVQVVVRVHAPRPLRLKAVALKTTVRKGT